LLQNVLANLVSPTGLTPEQTAAQQAIRGRAQNELTDALRTRANLGGGLFGGRAGGTEERAVSELQQAFSAEDINRQEAARQNAQQTALQSLGTLFPGAQITQPQFFNPVADPNAQFQSAAGQSNVNAQLAQQQQQSQEGLMSSLFQALGSFFGSAWR